MKNDRSSQLRRRQKSAIYSGMQVFQSVLLLLQLYLFVSVLESILAGKVSTSLPAAIFSLILLVVNIWMFVGLRRVELQS